MQKSIKYKAGLDLKVIKTIYNANYSSLFSPEQAQGKLEGHAMQSADGEIIEFSSIVPLEGPVEQWLCKIGKNYDSMILEFNVLGFTPSFLDTFKIIKALNNIEALQWFYY